MRLLLFTISRAWIAIYSLENIFDFVVYGMQKCKNCDNLTFKHKQKIMKLETKAKSTLTNSKTRNEDDFFDFFGDEFNQFSILFIIS